MCTRHNYHTPEWHGAQFENEGLSLPRTPHASEFIKLGGRSVAGFEALLEGRDVLVIVSPKTRHASAVDRVPRAGQLPVAHQLPDPLMNQRHNCFRVDDFPVYAKCVVYRSRHRETYNVALHTWVDCVAMDAMEVNADLPDGRSPALFRCSNDAHFLRVYATCYADFNSSLVSLEARCLPTISEMWGMGALRFTKDNLHLQTPSMQNGDFCSATVYTKQMTFRRLRLECRCDTCPPPSLDVGRAHLFQPSPLCFDPCFRPVVDAATRLSTALTRLHAAAGADITHHGEVSREPEAEPTPEAGWAPLLGSDAFPRTILWDKALVDHVRSFVATRTLQRPLCANFVEFAMFVGMHDLRDAAKGFVRRYGLDTPGVAILLQYGVVTFPWLETLRTAERDGDDACLRLGLFYCLPHMLCNTWAHHGHLDCIQWHHACGCDCGPGLCMAAASVGDLQMLKWVHQQGHPWGNVYWAAASEGRWHVLCWLHEHGVSLATCAQNACVAAAKRGDLRMVKWLYAHGAPCNVNMCMEFGAEHGHIDVVRWAAEQGATVGSFDLAAAADGGHWPILCMLRERGVPWDLHASHAAAFSGHLSILQRMVAAGAPLSSWVVAGAAVRNHSSVVKWLLERGCPVDASVCAAAAAGGHLAMLQWLRALKCPWDESTAHWAIHSDSPNRAVVEWVRDQQCPMNVTTKVRIDQWLARNR